MLKRFAPITISLVLAASVAAAADGSCSDGAAASPILTIEEANLLLHEVGQVKSIQPSPVKGLWVLELERDGRQGKAFLDFEKKNLIVGTVFPLSSGKAAGEGAASGAARSGKADPAAIPVAGSIVMGNPKGRQKLVVFTDPECPYCAKLHEELKKLVSVESDLAVYLKLLPLPMHPRAYTEARVILGAGSLEMLEKAYNREALPPLGANDSKKPVSDNIALAQSLGIEATPTLVLPDGEIVSGTMDVTSLRNLLSLHRKHTD